MMQTCGISILQVWPSQLMKARKVLLLHLVHLSGLNVCTCAEWTVNIVCLPQGVLWTIKVKVTCVFICLFLQVETSVVPALWKEYGKLTKYLISLNGWLNISKMVCDFYEVTLYLHIRVFCFKDWRNLYLWEFIIWTLIFFEVCCFSEQNRCRLMFLSMCVMRWLHCSWLLCCRLSGSRWLKNRRKEQEKTVWTFPERS